MSMAPGKTFFDRDCFDDEWRDVALRYDDTRSDFTIRVPVAELSAYHAGSAFCLVKMAYADDAVAMRPEDV